MAGQIGRLKEDKITSCLESTDGFNFEYLKNCLFLRFSVSSLEDNIQRGRCVSYKVMVGLMGDNGVDEGESFAVVAKERVSFISWSYFKGGVCIAIYF